MKNLLHLLLLSSLLYACEAADPKEAETAAATKESEPATEAAVEYQPIDTDEALVATVLMAAPKTSREGAKVIGYNTGRTL